MEVTDSSPGRSVCATIEATTATASVATHFIASFDRRLAVSSPVRLCTVGQPILAAAAFQAARRLKAGGGQDWPPHIGGALVPHFPAAGETTASCTMLAKPLGLRFYQELSKPGACGAE